MNIVNKELESYIDTLLPERDETLLEMEKYAAENNFPIVGPQAGTFLSQLAAIMGAQKIFEMGSGYGYSAYWLGRGMGKDSEIICTDGSEENRDRAMEFLKKGGYNQMVDFHVGDARDIIRNYDGPFDIIFNDIDKEQYPEALELALPRLRKGGIFITDNVLWSGRILDENPSESTRGVIEFNKKLFGTAELLSSIIPIRDGLGMAVKL